VRVVLAVVALGALGTGIAFLLNYRVIRLAGAGTTSMVTYLMPVFAAVAGVLVLGEGISWYEPVGAVVILAGVAVSQGLPRRRRPATAPTTGQSWAPAHSSSRSTDQVLTTASTGTAQRAARSQPLGSQSS
jgi:EamA domain-containing membrane protein RarD